MKCTAPGCHKPKLAKGLCDVHYWRVRKYGSLDLPPQPSRAERFWAKVDRSGDCWLWMGARGGSGYGIFGVGTGKTPEGAHRMAWILTFGPIPAGLWVLHRCDVHLCVRPTHLFLGTQIDNMRDMHNKGRAPSQTQVEVFARGAQNGAAKLTDGQVLTIRQRRAAGETLTKIAAAYGIDPTTVHNIARRHTWRHI